MRSPSEMLGLAPNAFVLFPQLKEEIRLGLATLEAPLEWFLDVLECSSDWKGKGQSLACHIARELQRWTKEHSVEPLVRLEVGLAPLLCFLGHQRSPASLL